MSQFRKYVVAEFKLKDIPSVPIVHRIKPGFADHDTNWEYFEVVEIAAFEAAQKEITELKKENYEIRCERQSWMNRIAEAEYVGNSCLEQLKMYKAALKVAEDALEKYKDSAFDIDGKVYKVGSKAAEALAEIQKIKKGLG